MAKPTGVSGAYRVQVGPEGGVSGSFEQISFPPNKALVELEIVNRFFASMNKLLEATSEQFFLSNPKQNVEDDFDFVVTTPNGPGYEKKPGERIGNPK